MPYETVGHAYCSASLRIQNKLNKLKRLGTMKLLSFIKETLADALRLAHSPNEGLKSLYDVSLYRNAVHLVLTSGATAVLGFAFWVP